MVKSKEIFITKMLISIACLVIVITGFKLASAVLIPVVFAVFLALLGLALVRRFEKIKIPRIISIFFVALFLFVSFVFLMGILKSSVSEFTEELPKYKDRFEQINVSLNTYLQKYNVSLPYEKFSDFFTIDQLMEFFLKSLKGIAGAVSNIIIVLVFVFFILFESTSLEKKLRYLFKDTPSFPHFLKNSEDIQTYILIKTFSSFITGVFVYTLVSFFGLDFPMLWGITAFIFNYVPIIGSIVAAIPAILLAVIQLGFGSAFGVALGYIIVNCSISYFIEPFLMGKNLGISPLVVLLSVFFWGWLWGPAGALLSVPLAMVIKILFENSHDFHKIGVLMGGGVPENKENKKQ